MPHLTLAGKDLDPYYHVCAFVKGRAEWAELMGDFFKAGLTGGEKCLQLNRLSAVMMMDILRTHPLTLVGGVVQENPFYTPTEELLPEIRRALGNA